MNRILILSFAILLVSMQQLIAGNGNEALMEQVDSHIMNGEPKKALKILSSRIDDEPENLTLLSKRAEIYVLMQRERDAYNELRAILGKDSEYCPAYVTYARLKVRVNQVDSALWYIEKGLSFDPDEESIEGLYGLKGKILMTREEFSTAENCLVKAANTGYASLETLRDLAAVMSENGKNDEAIIVLEESITRFGVRLEPLINAGFVCNKMGMYDEAISYLDLAISIDANNPYALANLADAYVRIGGLEMAYKKIERSISNDDTNAFAFKIKGDCLAQMGEPAKACKEYTRAYNLGYGVLFNALEIEALMISTCGGE